MQNELLCNLDKLYITELGIARIKRNLGLDTEDRRCCGLVQAENRKR